MKKDPREDLLILNEELDRMAEDVPEMPDGFHASWVKAMEDEMNNTPVNEEKINEQNESKVKTKKPMTWKKWTAIAAAAVVLVTGPLALKNAGNKSAAKYGDYSTSPSYSGSYADTVAGYSNGTSAMVYAESTANAYYEAADYEEDAEIATWQMGSDDTQTVTDPNAMIIRTVNLTLRTREYSFYSNYLQELCKKKGGWVESADESVSSSGVHTLSLTLRIPADNLDAWLTATESEDLIVERRNESATDVSESYHDTETRLATQRAKMERLQNMVAETSTMTELLMLESEIADTQYQIDRLESSLNSTERQVRYSTVNISLKEIVENQKVEVKQLSFGERLGSAAKRGGEAFVGFFEDLALFLAETLPLLLTLAAIVAAVVLIVKKKKKAKAAKVSEAKEE